MRIKKQATRAPGLLIAATAGEIAPFMDWYRSMASMPLTRDLDIMITGVGLTAATYSLTRFLSVKRPGFIIQAGIAGCYDSNIPLGAVVAVKKEAIADLGVLEHKKWNSIFDMGFCQKNEGPYSGGWLVNRGGLATRLRWKKVTGITVNQVTASPQMIRLYREKFNPVTESMEGAALHYVCRMENIPFLQLRAISNAAGDRNKKHWKIKEAVENLNRNLIRLLQTL